MKIVEINMTHEGSTGRIMLQLAEVARKNGDEVWTFSMPSFSLRGPKAASMPEIPNHQYVGSYWSRGFHTIFGMLLGRNGYFSGAATRKLIREMEKIGPDVVHLHNLHQFCIQLPMLFRYLKKKNIRIIWTLHDCWSFTGHCAHFDYIGCEKWKTGCHDCPQLRGYPKSFVDDSKRMWKNKKKWFTGLPDLTIVTPSDWLAGLVKQSYLKDYPVQVIHNGIDLSKFCPDAGNFREKHHLEDKYIVLGVAFGWGHRKGLDVFIELSKRLDDRYQIVLVGTDENTDAQLPEKILSIHCTSSQRELAEIYSAADVFVNPTREENFPTVNMEALACGTPVVTFRTGGSPEIPDETCGSVVPKDDVDALETEIRRVCSGAPFSRENCLKRAACFDMNDKFSKYIRMYYADK